MHSETRNERRALKVYGTGEGAAIADAVSRSWGLKLSELKLERFPDGEVKLRPEENVEGAEVFVFSSSAGALLHERIFETVFLLSALRDQGAAKVTAVFPYLPYARADRRMSPQDTLGLRHFAECIESSGVDCVAALDVHNVAAFENAFRARTIHIEALPLFLGYALERFPPGAHLTVFSPDIGGIKRAEAFRKALENSGRFRARSGFLEKYRSDARLAGSRVIGDVEGADVILFDDMISTGTTILRAAEALRRAGAGNVFVFATHGVFAETAVLDSPLIEEFVVTDSHPSARKAAEKLKIIPCASVFFPLHRPVLRDRHSLRPSA